MRYKVVIAYRDDTEETFTCIDAPYVSDWITLYLDTDGFDRFVIPKDAIKNIRYSIVKP